MQDYSTIEPAGGKRGGRFCSIDGCGRKHCAKGYCKTHYDRQRNGVSMNQPIATRSHGFEYCVVADCGRVPRSRGLCPAHHYRFTNGRDLTPPIGGLVPKQTPIGTRKVWRGGYVDIKVFDGHDGWRKEHRHVMEQHIGRELYPHENVHHKNGDRADNRLTNLELWTTSQPAGQRVDDKIAWAIGFLTGYGYSITGGAQLGFPLGAD